jgi:hypothetical protein
MATHPMGAEVQDVPSKSIRPAAWIAAGILVVVLGIVALGATAATPDRHALFERLQTAAAPARVPSRAAVRLLRRSVEGYSVSTAVTPNRASGPNGLSVRVTEHGRAVSGARVAITFSMPSMHMWSVYTIGLVPTADGRYAATTATLGMVGPWRLRVSVTPRSAPAFSITVNDRIAR